MTAVMNYETTLQPASHDAVFDADVQDSQPPRRWRKIALVVAAILVVALLGYWLFGGPAEPKPFAPSRRAGADRVGDRTGPGNH